MNWLKKTLGNSIFRRLLILFILILAPIYVIGYGIYNWGIRSILDDITRSVTSQGELYMNNLSDEIKLVKLLQYDLLNDNDLNKISLIPESMDNSEKTQSILRIYERLMVLKNSSNYIDTIYIHIPAISRTLSAQSRIMSIPDEKLNVLLNSLTSRYSQIVYWNSELMIAAMAPLPYQKWHDNPAYVIEIDLSAEAFHHDMQKINNYTGSNSFLINNKDGLVIAQSVDASAPLSDLENLNKRFSGPGSSTSLVMAGSRTYIAVYQPQDYLGMTLIRYIPETEIFNSANDYRIWFWIFSAVSLVIILLFSFSVYRMIQKPLMRLALSFRKVEEGDFTIKIDHKHKDEFRYIYQRFNAMVENIRILIDQVITEKTLAHRAEFKQLQSQINPHFLYNCFFILYRIAYAEGSDTTAKFADQLGRYFQFITRGTADDVLLSKEVEHARIYTDIQQMRFSNRIQIQFDELPEPYAGMLVPRLILQPVLENALEHGLGNVKQGGWVHITFRSESDLFIIAIEDNGIGMSSEELARLQNILGGREPESETTGIVNIHRRLQLKFGPESGVSVSPGESGGMKVELRIRLHTEVENVQALDRR